MERKNLPVKIFKKRDTTDDRRTEGGGNSELPPWVLPREELIAKSNEFIAIVGQVEEELLRRVRKDNHVPAVLKVTLREYATAKTHRTKVGKIFNVNRKANFIGMSDEYDLLIKVDDVRDAHNIAHNLVSIDQNAHGLSAIEGMELFSPFIEAESGTVKARLINFNSYATNQVAEALFVDELRKRNISYKKTKYAEDLNIFKLSDVAVDVLEDIKSFEALYSVTPMPQFSIGLDSVESDKEVPIRYPKAGVEYAVVGVLDSGVARIPHLAPWMTEDSFTSYPDELLDLSHGTFVAGVILYGDALEGKDWTNFEGCKIYSAAVFPNLAIETIDEDQLIENIREAVNSRRDIKIWNFSGGLIAECDLTDFSDFGKFLDDIQETNDLIICKSAGNCQNFLVPKTTQRIPKSADSIRSLVVGSIAHAKGVNDKSEIDWPSPFSRTGFGPNHLIKPDLTHYGGNAGKDSGGRMSISGVNSFSPSGTTISRVGTSFSTPRITSLVAGLHHNIAEQFNPLLLKAMIIHSAKYPRSVELSQLEKLKHMGYGLPSRVDDILYNSPNEITLILQDTLAKGVFYEILDFPYPEDMIDDGYFYGEVGVTLVSSPMLSTNDATEYCQSNIDVSLGTYDRVKQRDTNVSTIINEVGPDGAVNLLNESKYSRRILNNPLHEFANERLLRNYGDKYHPVKKYNVNLAELTATNREQALKAPKRWFLKLKGLYSAAAETQAAMDGTALAQDFCLIITIKDTRKNSNVYDSVSRQLNRNNFISQNIQLRRDVTIRS